jgi:dihydroflavonol-4-reductase
LFDMTAVVTGASGHVGANLTRALLDQGSRVRALVRADTRALEGLDVELVEGDVLDRGSLERVFESAELVFHLAAKISVGHEPFEDLRRLNVDGVQNVVEACLTTGVRRLVHFSSIHAFSPFPAHEEIDETRALTDPGDGAMPAYDRTKSAGQQVVLAAADRGLDAVIVNPTAVIGPNDFKLSALGSGIVAMMKRTLPALVAGGFDWVDARDVAAGAIAAAERGRTGEAYLLSGRWRPVVELARLVGEASGSRPPRIVCPMWLARVGAPFVNLWGRLSGAPPVYTRESLWALSHHRYITNGKAERSLGYRSRPLRETVADACAWYRSVGMA